MDEQKQSELYHHGVKGMKWGVIRDMTKAGSQGFGEAAKAADTVSKSRGISKKTKKQLSTMSDAELRAKINRMQMERQYADLNPSKVSRGASVANGVLSVIGNVTAIVSSAATVLFVASKLKK